ncbi:MAG: lamin tail domain-containing protein [Bacteroidia bacterium]|nr:lamin tail domain-containing protein [Bacteroidia bacterium]
MTSSLNKFGLIGFGLLMAAGALYFLLRNDRPELYINEFMANNSACCPNSIVQSEELADWIEIYNGGDVAVDIGGMYFSQKKLRREAFQIPKKNPSLTTIEPGGFLLLWADGDPGRGALHVAFKLDQEGEHIGFYDEDGRTIDTITFGSQKENVSWGRTRDGGKSWKEFVVPTPGQTNQ